MTNTTTSTVPDSDFIEDAINSYFHLAEKELNRKDIGDIEKRNWEGIRDKCKAFFHPIASPVPVEESNHTKGKLDNNLKDGNVYCGGIVIANCYSSFLMPKTIKSNAARIVQCWNEMDQLKADNALLIDGLKKINALSSEWDSTTHNQITEITKQLLSNLSK